MESVRVIYAPFLLRTFALYEDERLDFADAYLVACVETTGVGKVASFDKAISRISTVVRIEPWGINGLLWF